jgi:predicted nucleotide-binding protein
MGTDQRLFEAIQRKLGLSRAATYSRIAAQSRRLGERPDVAALEVASLAGINFQRFAKGDQLERLQRARATVTTHSASVPSIAPTASRPAKAAKRKKAKRPGKFVWIVHGRNDRARKAMFDFVRGLGLEPLEWNAAVKLTRQGSPYVGEVLAKAFDKASAVIVILTPDDDAMLKKEFWQRGEEAFEKKLMGQARPNVLFEAGMAFATHPSQTVLVEIGKCRPFTDTLGRLIVKMNDSPGKRKDLANRLAAAGCEVDLSKDAWLDAGTFETTK